MKKTPFQIATTEARRMALVMRELGGRGEPINSGWMVYDGPESWANYATGLGLNGPVTAAEIQQLIDFYDSHGVDARVQTTPYQDPSLFSALVEHGFMFDDFETMLVHDLETIPDASKPDLKFVKIDPLKRADVKAFVEAHNIGFFVPTSLAITERLAQHPRCKLWLLELDGELVGSGGLELFEESAVLIAGAVFPEARRKGIQTAFINHRLRVARELGMSYALVGSVPNGATERNALRQGFVPAMTVFQWRRRFEK